MKEEPDRCLEYAVDREAVAAALQAVPQQNLLDLLARTYQALGEPSRLKILHALLARELCVCELGEVLGASAPAVSHHLRRLKEQGLVKARREGKLVYYSLDDAHVEELLRAGRQHISHYFILGE